MSETIMKQLPRVSVSMSRKVNLGNYQSQDIFISLATDLDDGPIDGTVRKMLEDIQKIIDIKVTELLGDPND